MALITMIFDVLHIHSLRNVGLFIKIGCKTATITANNGDHLCEAALAGRGIVVSPTFVAGQKLKRDILLKYYPDIRYLQ